VIGAGVKVGVDTADGRELGLITANRVGVSEGIKVVATDCRVPIQDVALAVGGTGSSAQAANNNPDTNINTERRIQNTNPKYSGKIFIQHHYINKFI
jgi:hypothetical protein